MWKYFLILGALSGLAFEQRQYADVIALNPGPKYPPTKGEVWPKPQQEEKEDTFYVFRPSQFSFKITDYNCSILSDAIIRYKSVIKNFYNISKRSRRFATSRRHISPLCSSKEDAIGHGTCNAHLMAVYQGVIQVLQVELTQPCEEYPHLDMDESYNLTVSTVSKLTSGSIWGILRGLETFSQLFYLSDEYTDVRINTTRIVDYPRYAHRGLLLDTSRHFISMTNILKTLDAMAMNKMNVFHWHIVDDQSFPYESQRFPSLSEKGAYHPSMVYTKLDIQTIVDYARDRGIRVLPEFDTPGHTRSWGIAYPNILTKCYSTEIMDGSYVGLGPLNPISNVTYKLLRELFKEVQDWFPDHYFHIGGDEVELSCWKSNPDIETFMRIHDIKDVKALHALFMRNTIALLGNGSKIIVWQEVFDEKVPLSDDTIVQVWKNGWVEEMVNVLESDHKVIFSSSWYLDNLSLDVKRLYEVDPRQLVLNATGNPSLLAGVLGGEACMWGEMVDDRNVMSRVWPRTSAVAEVLWSPLQLPTCRDEMPESVLYRLEEHTCRMIRRGVPAEPSAGPGFCLV